MKFYLNRTLLFFLLIICTIRLTTWGRQGQHHKGGGTPQSNQHPSHYVSKQNSDDYIIGRGRDSANKYNLKLQKILIFIGVILFCFV